MLNREQVVASNWVGGCLLIALLALIAGAATGFPGTLLMTAFVFGFLVLPLAGTFNCARGWPRTAMALYTAGMAAVGILGLLLLLGGPGAGDAGNTARSGAVGLFTLFFIAALGSSWVANILIAQRPRK